MFRIELGIIIYFGIVKPKHAIALPDLDVQIWITSEDLIIKGAILVGCSYIVDLVDDRVDAGGFI